MVLEELRDRIKHYFWFTPTEITGFLVSILVASFVYSFDHWGSPSFDFTQGLENWLSGIVLFTFIIFIHHGAQRITALNYGFRPEHNTWWYGLVGSLLLCVLTNGWLKWYAFSGTLIQVLPTQRLGRFRYGPNVQSFANVAAMGPVANVCAAAFVKTLSWIIPIPLWFVDEWFTQNLLFAAWNMLPIPPLDGSRMLYASRLFYIFVFGALFGYVFLVGLGIYSFLFAILLGLLAWFLFYYYVERD